jgi:hypothetical protein
VRAVIDRPSSSFDPARPARKPAARHHDEDMECVPPVQRAHRPFARCPALHGQSGDGHANIARAAAPSIETQDQLRDGKIPTSAMMKFTTR